MVSIYTQKDSLHRDLENVFQPGKSKKKAEELFRISQVYAVDPGHLIQWMMVNAHGDTAASGIGLADWYVYIYIYKCKKKKIYI